MRLVTLQHFKSRHQVIFEARTPKNIGISLFIYVLLTTWYYTYLGEFVVTNTNTNHRHPPPHHHHHHHHQQQQQHTAARAYAQTRQSRLCVEIYFILFYFFLFRLTLNNYHTLTPRQLLRGPNSSQRTRPWLVSSSPAQAEGVSRK